TLVERQLSVAPSPPNSGDEACLPHAKWPKRRILPAVLMRAGTSKGLFIQRKDLPPNQDDWSAPLLAAMGSSLSDTRQIDGVGGATSTTSKVAVVGPSQISGIDVDYTFVQVAVGSNQVDLSGSCGNMAAGVGPFALQEGLLPPATPGQTSIDVRIFNTNTSRLMIETLQLTEGGDFEENGDYVISGVKGSGSEVKIGFVDPAGSMTGQLFPTGRGNEQLVIRRTDGSEPMFTVMATLIDITNPFILVHKESLPEDLQSLPPSSEMFAESIEAIRREGAVKMKLAPSLEAASLVRGTPKIVLISSTKTNNTSEAADINVQAFSMGKPHPTLQISGAVCLAAAVCIPDTIAAKLNSKTFDYGQGRLPSPPRELSPRDCSENLKRLVKVAHPSGMIQVEVIIRYDVDGLVIVDRCLVSRTARRIFEGNVMYYLN
ncbi:unnamed protein product, partial [Clonostachys rosea]